jgi:hypothetical protein
VSAGARRVGVTKRPKKTNVLEKKPKKLSGSAFRKRRRERLTAAGVPAVLIRSMDVGRLRTLQDWRVQIARIYRRMARGELPEYLGTKLAYVANLGAILAKANDELRELTKLREQLAALQQGGPAALIGRTHFHDTDAIDGAVEVSAHEPEEP